MGGAPALRHPMPELGSPSPSFLGSPGQHRLSLRRHPWLSWPWLICKPLRIGWWGAHAHLGPAPSLGSCWRTREGWQSLGRPSSPHRWASGRDTPGSCKLLAAGTRWGAGVGSGQEVQKEEMTHRQGLIPGLWRPLSCGWPRAKSANTEAGPGLPLPLPSSRPRPRDSSEAPRQGGQGLGSGPKSGAGEGFRVSRQGRRCSIKGETGCNCPRTVPQLPAAQISVAMLHGDLPDEA